MDNVRKNIKKVLKEYDEEELYDYESNFSADDLLKYIASEWDTEMLEIINSKIQDRLSYLYTVSDATSKKEIEGFKRYDQ